jgi:hypothetical protein
MAVKDVPDDGYIMQVRHLVAGGLGTCRPPCLLTMGAGQDFSVVVGRVTVTSDPC